MKDFIEWHAEVLRLVSAAHINESFTREDLRADYDAGKTPSEALYARYPVASPDYNPQLYTKYLRGGSRWRHTSGKVYTVMFLTNIYSTDYHRYPPTVVYQDIHRQIWSRPASDWDRSMTRIPDNWLRRFFSIQDIQQ